MQALEGLPSRQVGDRRPSQARMGGVCDSGWGGTGLDGRFAIGLSLRGSYRRNQILNLAGPDARWDERQAAT